MNVCILANKKKTPRKTQNKHKLKILNISMSNKGSPVFTYSLPGEACFHDLLSVILLRFALFWCN